MIQIATISTICESRGLNHSGKPNSDLFESEVGVERAVDSPQRISLSDLEQVRL